MPTIAELIHAAAQDLTIAAGDDARLEAEVLLAHVMRTERAQVLARLHEEAPAGVFAGFESVLARRVAREPLAYIVGEREFYALNIACTPAALIPRPETELLVDFALQEIGERGADARIIDVGTGTGAIAVAVAVNAPSVHIAAVDSSPRALALARQNVERHRVADRTTLREADLLDNGGSFAIILANLPYINEADWEMLAPEIRDHEPREALVAGPTGTEAIERLLSQAPEHLAAGGALAAEIGNTQAARLASVAQSFFPDAGVYVMKDLAGMDRMLVVRTKGESIE